MSGGSTANRHRCGQARHKRQRELKMKNIRTIIKELRLHSRWNDAEIQAGATEVHYDLNPAGGIQEHEVEHLVALDCGHFAQAHCLCAVCERVQCRACSVVCSCCAKPVGKCHAEEADGAWHCFACRAAQRRAARLRAILSPIFRFKEDQR